MKVQCSAAAQCKAILIVGNYILMLSLIELGKEVLAFIYTSYTGSVNYLNIVIIMAY